MNNGVIYWHKKKFKIINTSDSVGLILEVPLSLKDNASMYLWGVSDLAKTAICKLINKFITDNGLKDNITLWEGRIKSIQKKYYMTCGIPIHGKSIVCYIDDKIDSDLCKLWQAQMDKQTWKDKLGEQLHKNDLVKEYLKHYFV